MLGQRLKAGYLIFKIEFKTVRLFFRLLSNALLKITRYVMPNSLWLQYETFSVHMIKKGSETIFQLQCLCVLTYSQLVSLVLGGLYW